MINYINNTPSSSLDRTREIQSPSYSWNNTSRSMEPNKTTKRTKTHGYVQPLRGSLDSSLPLKYTSESDPHSSEYRYQCQEGVVQNSGRSDHWNSGKRKNKAASATRKSLLCLFSLLLILTNLLLYLYIRFPLFLSPCEPKQG